MKKIRFMLEYGCSPIWVYNNNSLKGIFYKKIVRHKQKSQRVRPLALFVGVTRMEYIISFH
jgi:hypothetical protein